MWWGPGAEVGAVPLVDGRWYWFATANLPPGTRYPDEHAEVRRRVSDWPAPVRTLVDATPPDAVLHHDLLELPPLRTYVTGRVALLGDAAHAMTPNLGQGACLALEDAVELAACLREGGGLPAYDRRRRPRTQRLARASRRLGRLVQREGRVATAVRDGVVRLVPPRVTMASLRRTTAWRAPAL
ncbi:MAG: FAD-dependent monooxygenase [Actinomycetota bacterium]|nr:FAD-dependent monooxygenase [Actinomycetota bacterium]